jgi:hypothetical protein
MLLEREVSFDADGGVPHKIAGMEDRELWVAFFRNSQENLVALMCEVRNL